MDNLGSHKGLADRTRGMLFKAAVLSTLLSMDAEAGTSQVWPGRIAMTKLILGPLAAMMPINIRMQAVSGCGAAGL
jgi:hypothetical protein